MLPRCQRYGSVPPDNTHIRQSRSAGREDSPLLAGAAAAGRGSVDPTPLPKRHQTAKQSLLRRFCNQGANQLLVHKLLDTHVAEFAAITGILDAAERQSGSDHSMLLMNIIPVSTRFAMRLPLAVSFAKTEPPRPKSDCADERQARNYHCDAAQSSGSEHRRALRCNGLADAFGSRGSIGIAEEKAGAQGGIGEA